MKHNDDTILLVLFGITIVAAIIGLVLIINYQGKKLEQCASTNGVYVRTYDGWQCLQVITK